MQIRYDLLSGTACQCQGRLLCALGFVKIAYACPLSQITSMICDINLLLYREIIGKIVDIFITNRSNNNDYIGWDSNINIKLDAVLNHSYAIVLA